ncbi:hypothetical protein M427DRAFT_335021 [Gonapodya prolifera JEL478]|uniref:Crinkler effector protein N-terminal domain-containing protein n=1 Tax=Gonapodya prolifera (strain JEL478) TaxID=1344416 RepID=A0A139AE18_GONPJ|nr:hypothetical protein M427DRAFT_335021 [Gonapodya prolifera JEL478]|eukprot:KXS14834.1 hypothetical protein M427DRAFT_335021 [Gonapodya prolifera JEL478]
MRATEITLGCLSFEKNETFEVSIALTSSVNSLKKAIIEELNVVLSGIDVLNLELWRADVECTAKDSITAESLKDADLMEPLIKHRALFLPPSRRNSHSCRRPSKESIAA